MEVRLFHCFNSAKEIECLFAILIRESPETTLYVFAAELVCVEELLFVAVVVLLLVDLALSAIVNF